MIDLLRLPEFEHRSISCQWQIEGLIIPFARKYRGYVALYLTRYIDNGRDRYTKRVE